MGTFSSFTLRTFFSDVLTFFSFHTYVSHLCVSTLVTTKGCDTWRTMKRDGRSRSRWWERWWGWRSDRDGRSGIGDVGWGRV